MPAWNSGYDYSSFAGRRDAGLTVLDYLSSRYPHSTEAEWRSRIDAGRVRVEGERVDPGRVLVRGEKVVWSRPPWQEPDVPGPFAVIYRDEHLLGVAKPGGLPTVAGGGYLQHTLLALVRRHYPEANPLHRLGRPTSGVVLFARTGTAARIISGAWHRGEMAKTYRALASGSPRDDAFSIEAPIGLCSHRVLGAVYAASPGGKPALSHVRVLERREGATIVKVRIVTGRSHQVRIHMAAAGYPLVGDRLYVAGGGIADDCAALPGDSGFLLHAERLSFRHPFTDTWTEVSCCPPPSLRTRQETSRLRAF